MDFNKHVDTFIKYVEQFDNSNNKIKRKRIHTLKVVEISEKLAKNLNLNEDDIYLAKLIGLLHDIGRFEQAKKYDSFKDDQMDHADYAVELLFKDNFIRNFIDNKKYDNIIYNAIKYHNKLALPKGLDTRTEMFCKLIRDADKIDIFRVKTVLDNNLLIDKINKEALELFYQNKSVAHKYVQNESDATLLILSFIYDINFKQSFDYLNQTNLFNNFIKSIKVSDDNKELFNSLMKELNIFIIKKENICQF